ncbi:MAG: HAMP domain-containing histidine kinase [Verrucomicrobiales bacterium]|nr:HAMP domain-containing histidine kinase [Verrucomicrobiales bacterium]MCP5525983.1 HAMP domain-containing histidine kinase [Verrucomicrobiales bacterium]
MNAESSRTQRTRRFLPGLIVGLTLAVFAAGVLAVTLHLREKLRVQIAGREAAFLHRLTLLQEMTEPDETEEDEGVNEAEILALDPDLADEEADSSTGFVVLDKARRLMEVLDGLLGIRVYGRHDQIIATLPLNLKEALFVQTDWAALGSAPQSRLDPIKVQSLFTDPFMAGFPDDAEAPVLRLLLPLQRRGAPERMGAVEFLLDGAALQAEFRALDRSLWGQALGSFLVGGGLTAAVLLRALSRLQSVNRLLEHRTQDLLRANAELALSARTSAVGAVTAHLLHGLKNPLAGLRSLVADKVSGSPAEDADLWQEAARSAQRMQTMVQEVTRLLAEEQGGAVYALTLAELIGLIGERLRPVAQRAGVELELIRSAQGELDNHRADLILLILENLVRNAVEATPAGGLVRVGCSNGDEQIRFRIEDTGPGLDPGIAERVFRPVRSTKPGGSGIGLAISRQLATHLGARLELAANSEKGAAFTLTIPIQKPACAGTAGGASA